MVNAAANAGTFFEEGSASTKRKKNLAINYQMRIRFLFTSLSVRKVSFNAVEFLFCFHTNSNLGLKIGINKSPNDYAV